jgi:hypothetical protein
MMSWIFWSTTCSVELRKCSRDINCNWSFITDLDETEIGNSEQLEGEDIIHDQKTEGGSIQKEQPAGIKIGGKTQN